MSDQSELIVRRVVQIQVPPEQEQAAHAADVAALPPVQNPACDLVFAGQVDAMTKRQLVPDSNRQPTNEEKQAEAAMVLLFAQQLALTHAAKERRLPVPPERIRQEDEEDSEDA